ncbi:hypothetical protein [Mycolicibacterium sp.]|uniref:hypothetical protein n=1 Tax=Mycolicibacterium sp. TaxID=2320850 RepID=UPI003D14ECA7
MTGLVDTARFPCGEGASAAGALTVGVGDNGNEIGFGNIGAHAEALTPAGVDAGLRSGGVDDPEFRGDDGIPLPYVAATAEMFAGIVHQASLGEAWVAVTPA